MSYTELSKDYYEALAECDRLRADRDRLVEALRELVEALREIEALSRSVGSSTLHRRHAIQTARAALASVAGSSGGGWTDA